MFATRRLSFGGTPEQQPASNNSLKITRLDEFLRRQGIPIS